MSSPESEQELQTEVELLRKRLRKNEQLMRDAFRLMEDMCAAIETLKDMRRGAKQT